MRWRGSERLRLQGAHGLWRWLPPAIALGMLVVVRPFVPVDAYTPAWAGAYFAEIREAASRIPYRVGDWVGADVDVPPAARELLKPNVLMQRRFVNPNTGQTFNVLLVHCGDTRDMQGHYPPICYKGQGWGSPVAARKVTLALGEGRIPATDYEFRQFMGGSDRRLRVIDFFTLPREGDPFASDMKALDEASSLSLAAVLGAGQVQLIAGDTVSEGDRLRLAELFLEALKPTLETIAQGGRHG